MKLSRTGAALWLLLLLSPACGVGGAPSQCDSPLLTAATGGYDGDRAIILWHPDGQADVVTDGPVYAPAISPDGNWVAFALARGTYSDTYGYADGSEVAIVSVLTREVTVLSAPVGTSGVDGMQWSADGSEIAFTRQGNSTREIVAIRVEDRTERHLLDVTDIGSSRFSWSPDGAELLIPANETGRQELRRYTIRTGDYTVIDTEHEALTNAVWSPDGIGVAIIAEIPGTTRPRLWILDLATGDTQPIDRRRGYPEALTWSGRYLIYSYQLTIPGNEEATGPTLMRWDSVTGSSRSRVRLPSLVAVTPRSWRRRAG